jgi:hypothetical protein
MLCYRLEYKHGNIKSLCNDIFQLEKSLGRIIIILV